MSSPELPPQSDSVRGTESPSETARIVRKKAAKPQFTSTMLVLEAFVVVFATLVAVRLVDAPPARLWLAGGVLTLVLLVLSRLVSVPGGYVAGTVVQVPVLAIGILIPLMIPVALVFIALWVVSLRLGAKIDRERAEYDAAHPETAPQD